MKKSICTALIFAAAAALIFFFAQFTVGVKTAGANYFSIADQSYNTAYGFYYEEFNITYDIASNRKIAVREEMTVTFTGSLSTGYMRDIPVNGGELVKNVKVCELVNGSEASVKYDVYDYEDDYGADYITADIGDSTNKKGQTHTYVLTYDYCLTKAQEGKDVIALNAIGAQSREVKSTTIKVILPDGFMNATCVKGKTLSEDEYDFEQSEENGRTVLTATASLEYNEGITFNLAFKEGVLSTYFDFTPYYFALAGLALLALLFAVKFLVFSKNKIVPVINYEAPEKMSPLLMGKLIDNNVDTEDITSMIFHWADKGYLKIDLSDENDPVLIRINQQLPQNTPAYEKKLYDGLWRGQDVLRTSSLKYKFYTTADSVKADVNKQVTGLYDKKSNVVSVIFAVLGGLLFGVSSLLAGLTISPKYLSFIAIPFVLVFSLCMYYVFRSLHSYRLKSKNGKNPPIVTIILIIIIAMFMFGFTLMTPSYVIPFVARIAIIAIGAAVSFCSVLLISYTPEYTEKLNGIMGFADFIKKAEKDQLEMLINENPQFYYHVLPYAQVLGISNIWEDKFKDIVVPPPQWCVGSTYAEFYMINRMIRHSSSAMRTNLGTRPASASGGSGRGGFGGGHVGGGHGGGGSRGR